MKVLFTYDYGKEKLDEVSKLGYDVEFYEEKNIDKYEDYSNVDILVCYNTFDKVDLKKFTNLKLILLSSIGIDQVPLDIIKENNITLCNNKGGYSIPMGEWVVMKILELTKNSKFHYDNQNKNKWFMDTTSLEIFDKKVLFFGTGTIAYEAAKRLKGFGVELIGLNTTGHLVEMFDICAPLKNAKKYVKEADVIIISLPSTKKTKGVFNNELIDLMKSSSIIINIARGDIIDENYLINALKDKKIRGAALDVFINEPLSKNHPLWELDNVSVTAHNSWISEKRNQRRFDAIYKNLNAYINEDKLNNIVDIYKGY